MMLSKAGFVVSFALLSSLGFAQESFRSEAGVREFTGHLIVKPRSEQSFHSARATFGYAATARYRAILRLQSFAIKREESTDEFLVRVPHGSNETTYARQLMATGDYEYVQPDWRVRPVRISSDPRFTDQWHHNRVRTPDVWNLTLGSSSLSIAFCDTGVALNHPDLRENLVPGFNAVISKSQAEGGDVSDINGHGTMTAGAAAAVGDNGLGGAGMAWRAKIMPIRVSDRANGAAMLSTILRGARWAADNGAKVISVSFSGGNSGSIETTAKYVKSKGALLIWAAGNDGRKLAAWTHPSYMVVGATDSEDRRPSFSNWGPSVDIFAPGTGIVTTSMGGGYVAASGTSLSAPLTSGLAALVWSANPRLSVQQVQEVIGKSAQDLGAKGRDENWGWGRIDALAAVRLGIRTSGKGRGPWQSTDVKQDSQISSVLNEYLNP